MCADLSGQWLREVVNGHGLKEATVLRAVNEKDLPKPVKMAVRTWKTSSKILRSC